MYKHILIPTDGSALSLKAAREAAKLAGAGKAKVTALYVIRPYMPPVMGDGYVSPPNGTMARRYRETSEKTASKALDKLAAAAGPKVRCDKVFVTNDEPWAGIIKAARDRKCDVIVMASRGRGAIAGLLLGSETTKVLSHSKTPVLVCR
jgi:nucleotide-binding universal stress UspA family protein